MKAIKILFVLILLWLTLVSCGKKTEDEINSESTPSTNSINTSNTNSSSDANTNSSSEDTNIESSSTSIGEETINNNTTWEVESNLDSNSETTMSNKTEVISGDNISVHYTWTLEDGTKFDSSLDRGTPLEFMAWKGQMIPWFDAWVIGMKLWEKKIMEIEAKDAYWEYDETKIQVIPKKDLESFATAWYKLEVDEKIPTQMWELKIINTDEENVTLDVNHPLAWKKLIFDVEIISIK